MKKQAIYVAAFVAIAADIAIPRTAHAQLVVASPTIEVALWTEIKATTAGFAEQISHLSTMVANAKAMLSTFNTVAAFARQTYAAYEFLRHLDKEYVLSAVKEGLYEQVPELRELETEVLLAQKNREGLLGGTEKFLSVRDYHDRETQQALGATAAFAYRASVYPIAFPNAKRYREKITEAEKLVAMRYQRLGWGAKRAIDNAGQVTMAAELQAGKDEADKKKRVDLSLAASTAQATHQTMINTQELRDAEEARIAEEEARLIKREREREITTKTFAEKVRTIRELGVVQ